MKEYLKERTKSFGLFIVQVFVSVTLLVLLALAVGGLPVHEDVHVQTSEDMTMLKRYGRIPEKWRELDEDERSLVLQTVEQEVGSTVGPIYIALGTPEPPFRLTKNEDETHLFDAYGVMFPGCPLPNVLLCPATSSISDDLPPSFHLPPLRNIHIQPASEAERMKIKPAQVPADTRNQRIPGFMYYNGILLIVPRALGKIGIKMSAVNRMTASSDHQ